MDPDEQVELVSQLLHEVLAGDARLSNAERSLRDYEDRLETTLTIEHDLRDLRSRDKDYKADELAVAERAMVWWTRRFESLQRSAKTLPGDPPTAEPEIDVVASTLAACREAAIAIHRDLYRPAIRITVTLDPETYHAFASSPALQKRVPVNFRRDAIDIEDGITAITVCRGEKR